MNDGRFHKHIQDTFAPLVVRYVDLMESSIGQSIHKGFEKENWKNRGLYIILIFINLKYSFFFHNMNNKLKTRMLDIRRHALEARRTPIVYQRSALARRSFCRAS